MERDLIDVVTGKENRAERAVALERWWRREMARRRRAALRDVRIVPRDAAVEGGGGSRGE